MSTRLFKLKEEAEQYGLKNYFRPIVEETIQGNFKVREDETNAQRR